MNDFLWSNYELRSIYSVQFLLITVITSVHQKGGFKMAINVIDTQSQFLELKESWDRLYALDGHLSVHRSWDWIDSWIRSTDLTWFILVVQSPTGEVVAILPLAKQVSKRGAINFVLAGHPISAHTGLICHPDYEAYALHKISKYFKKNPNWNNLIFSDALDSRLNNLISSFNEITHSILHNIPTPCPYVDLPQTWDEYLRTYLGPKTRSDARNLIKHMEDLPDFKLVIASKDNIDELLDITMNLWTKRWGADNAQLIYLMRGLILNSINRNILRLAVYMDGPVAFASIVSWLDDVKNEYQAFLFCFNKEYSKLKSPGKAAIFNEIRFAINEGYSLFNFGRGEEGYKKLFGIDIRMNSNYTVSRKTWRRIIKSFVIEILKDRNESMAMGNR